MMFTAPRALRRTFVLGLLLTVAGLVRADDAPSPDIFQPGASFSGIQQGDTRKPNTPQAKEHPAQFKVIDRDGDAFTAEFWVNAPRERRGIELKGRIVKGKLAARATKIIKGSNWENGVLDVVWNGALDGKNLILEHDNNDHNIRTAKLTLDDPSDEPSKGRRGNK